MLVRCTGKFPVAVIGKSPPRYEAVSGEEDVSHLPLMKVEKQDGET